MHKVHFTSVVVLSVVLIAGPGVPTYMSAVGTAVAQEEEEVMTKQRGKKRSRGQVSKPSFEKKKKRKKKQRSKRIHSRGIETPSPLVIPDPEPPALPNFALKRGAVEEK